MAMTEPRSLENPAVPFASLLSESWGEPTHSGVAVSESKAMTTTAVYACVRIIAETVAGLPFDVFERIMPRGRNRAVTNPIHRLLHDEPNDMMTSFIFRETLQSHALLWGNGYAAIGRLGDGTPYELLPLDPSKVKVGRVNGKKVYLISTNGQDIPATDADILHIPGLGFDGLSGYSVIQLLRQAIGLTLAAEEFGARFFGNGTATGIVLETDKTMTDQAYNRLRESWNEMHKGVSKSHRPAILEEGLKASKITIPPEDAQFLETRKFQVQEISRAFRVPPHMLADLERATFSNIAQQSLDFEKHTIRRWLVVWEQEVNRKLFSQADRTRFYAEHNVDGLLRGDIESRYRAYAQGRQWGWLSCDDIRERENMNPLPDGAGDIYLTPANMYDSANPIPSPTMPTAPARSINLLPIITDAINRLQKREADTVKKDGIDTAFANLRKYAETVFGPVAEAAGKDVAAMVDRYISRRKSDVTSGAQVAVSEYAIQLIEEKQ